MVKTKARPKCAQSEPAVAVEDQIDAALSHPGMPELTQLPAAIELRPYDIMRVHNLSFERSMEADGHSADSEKLKGDFLVSRSWRTASVTASDMSWHIQHMIPLVRSQSLADATAQLQHALHLLDEAYEGQSNDCDREEVVRNAARCIFGAFPVVANASEKPLQNVMGLWAWIRSAEIFGDVRLSREMHGANISEDKTAPHAYFPRPKIENLEQNGQDDALLEKYRSFAAALAEDQEAQKTFKSDPDQRDEAPSFLKWMEKNDTMLAAADEVQALRPERLEGLLAKARVARALFDDVDSIHKDLNVDEQACLTVVDDVIALLGGQS